MTCSVAAANNRPESPLHEPDRESAHGRSPDQPHRHAGSRCSRAPKIRCSMLDVRRLLPLPAGEGWGEGERNLGNETPGLAPSPTLTISLSLEGEGSTSTGLGSRASVLECGDWSPPLPPPQLAIVNFPFAISPTCRRVADRRSDMGAPTSGPARLRARQLAVGPTAKAAGASLPAALQNAAPQAGVGFREPNRDMCFVENLTPSKP